MKRARGMNAKLDISEQRFVVYCMGLVVGIGAIFLGPSWSHATSGTGFIANHGQVNGEVQYYVPGSQASVYFTSEGVVVDLAEKSTVERSTHTSSHTWSDQSLANASNREGPFEVVSQRRCAVWMRFDGAHPSPHIEARGALPTLYNFLKGHNPERWRAGVRAYTELIYHDLWPGIDVLFRLEGRAVCYELLVRSESNLDRVRYRYEGSDHVTVSDDGSYRIHTPVGSVTNLRLDPDGRDGMILYAVKEEQTCGDAGTDEKDNPNAVVWSTFLGGSQEDSQYEAVNIATDRAGNLILTGSTSSSNFPTTAGAYDVTYNGDPRDAFVAKLDKSGSTLLWSTFLGGNSSDSGYGIALDSSDNPVVAGQTYASGASTFPTTEGAYDRSHNGAHDVFVTKLNASGNALLWSTFIGGSSSDEAFSVVLDGSGNPLITGIAWSSNFPTTTGAYDRTFNGGDYDIFVAKLDPAGSSLVWSTFLGGGDKDYARTIIRDPSGMPILVGNTLSSNFPTTVGAYDESHNGSDDGIVVKLDATGSTLLWSTFLGGGNQDYVSGVVLDNSGNVLVTGQAGSADFPTTDGAYDNSIGGNWDAFIAKLDPSASSLLWSSFLGGEDDETGRKLSLDATGNPLVIGGTSSSDFPTTSDGYDQSHNGSLDAFVTRLDSSGSDLLWSTYLGGSNWDQAYCMVSGSSDTLVVAGTTGSADFPTTLGAYDTSHNGQYDVFITKLVTLDLSGVKAGDIIRGAYHLRQVCPNPTNASCTINYDIGVTGRVIIIVYDVRGRLTRILTNDEERQIGCYGVEWDCRDNAGYRVVPGVYFYELRVGGVKVDRAQSIVLR